MAKHKLLRPILINTPNENPVIFTDDSNAEVAAASATKMMMVGQTPTIPVGSIFKVIGSRGAEGTKNVITLDNSNVTVSGSVPANTIVQVYLDAVSSEFGGQFARFGGLDGITEYHQIALQSGDTYDVFLAKLYNAIREDSFMNLQQVVTVEDQATITSNTAGTFAADGTATSITTLNLTARDTSLDVRLQVAGPDTRFTSPFVKIGTPIVTTPQFFGINNYDSLKGQFLEFDRLPYSRDYRMTPIEGALYTSFTWSTLVHNSSLGGGQVPNQYIESTPLYTVYINEVCTDLINNLADFFNNATVLSTANPARFDAPLFYDNSQAEVAVAAFKI